MHPRLHLSLAVAILLLVCGPGLDAAVKRLRLTWRDDPTTTMVVVWEQASGSNPVVHYDTADHGSVASAYRWQRGVDRQVWAKGMDTRSVRLSGLEPDTAYYFVIRDSGGTSQRWWFRTAPSIRRDATFIAGGDSRNSSGTRRAANTLVSKLRPLFVAFGGDLTDNNTDTELQTWLDHWQDTVSADGRAYPVLVARGNHDSNQAVHELFDTARSDCYDALDVIPGHLRCVTLNSEIATGGNQASWLEGVLASNPPRFTVAQYHKPMRPHTSGKSEGWNVYDSWAGLFHRYGVSLVVECDSHMVKRTWPIRPSTDSGHDEGFVRDDETGTVYVGEGCWGAPLRPADDGKAWTRAMGRFDQFQWVRVFADRMELATVRIGGSGSAGTVSDADPTRVPAGLDLWSPSSGTWVVVPARGGDTTAPVRPTGLRAEVVE